MNRHFMVAAVLVWAADAATTTIGLWAGADEVVPGSAVILAAGGPVAMHVAAALGTLTLCALVAYASHVPWRVRAWAWGGPVAVLSFKAAAAAHNLVIIGRLHG